MKNKSLKRYRLPLSRVFPATHPRRGEATNFQHNIENAVIRGEFSSASTAKLHTIRENYEYWSKRIDEVNAGNAVLELYCWEGLPYRSKTRALFTFDKNSGIGYQRLEFMKDKDSNVFRDPVVINAHYTCYPIPEKEIAANDGLSVIDFRAWFAKAEFAKPMIIIHFTKFRY